MLFSKLLSGLWPHFDSLGKKCVGLYSDYKEGKDLQKYVTNGTEDRKMIETKKNVKSMTLKEQSPVRNSNAGNNLLKNNESA